MTLQRAASVLFAVNVAVLVVALIGSCVVCVCGIPGWNYQPAAMALVLENALTCGTIALLLMASSQGWRNALLLLGLCGLIAGGMEWTSMVTAFPCGATYRYSAVMGPTVGGLLPYLIPVAWLMMLYPCLQIAFTLSTPRWLVPVTAAGLMTLWDVVLDPAMTTHLKLWAWDYQGGFYGIPLWNYLSWFVTSLTIVWAYLWLARGWRADRSRLPFLLYGLQGGFVAVLSALVGRGAATLVWLAGFGVLSLARRSRPAAGEQARPVAQRRSA